MISLQNRLWICAQNDDGKFISTYAKGAAASEDIAESILPWLAVTYRAGRTNQNDVDTVKETIPNRMKYFNREIAINFP